MNVEIAAMFYRNRSNFSNILIGETGWNKWLKMIYNIQTKSLFDDVKYSYKENQKEKRNI